MNAIKLSSARIDVPEDVEAVFEEMYNRGWTDGLPVIPPTEERVQRMVDYVGLPGDEVISEVAPDEGIGTVEKLAIAAVMAGCRKEYLPVIIAAVQALAEPQFNLLGIQTTTNPVAPLLVINGPIRNELDVNCGRGALGPCWRANATIGRAVKLILLNLGGAKPGKVDKAIHGMPGKYTFCFGEFEEESPWEPFHVELGFSPEESVVTAIGAQGTQNTLAAYRKPESILMMVADSMAVYGNNNYMLGWGGNPVVIFSSGYAKIFNDAGWSKPDIKAWLFDHTKIPLSQIPEERHVVWRPELAVLDGDRLCVCGKPENIVILVAGGPEPYHVTYIPNFGDTRMVSKPIVYPAKEHRVT